jgi:hypothetical protein
MSNQENSDYKNNPLYSDEYSKMQGLSATPSLQYTWDSQSGKWIPNSSEDKFDLILKTLSGQLSGIHIEAKIDHDEVSHDYLSSISGTSVESKEILSDVLAHSQSGSALSIIGLTGLMLCYGELEDIDSQLEVLKTHIINTSNSTASLLGFAEEEDVLLKSISGSLTGSLYEQESCASTLEGINSSLEGLVSISEDLEGLSAEGNYQAGISNKWLEGISGELSSIDVHVSTDADTTSHQLLSGISGELSSIDIHVSTDEDVKSHNLLSGISGQLEVNKIISRETALANQLLSGISGELSSIDVHVSTDADVKSHELLSGISEGLSGINVHVSTDADIKSHELLSGISGQLDGIEVGVTVDSDVEAHELLRSISGESFLARRDLNKIVPILSGKLITSDAKTHQALVSVSGLAELNNALSRLHFTKRTDTFEEKIEADHILLEAPDSEVYGGDPAPEYGVNRDILDDLFNAQYKNGRDNPNTPEAGQFFMLDESAPSDRPKQRKYAFDTEAQYALKLDSFQGNLDGAQRLSDHGLKNIQNVTILNDSIYPIKIYSSETNYKGFYLYDGHSVSIDNTNASDIMIKREHLVSGFNVDYTITYLDPNAEINLERVVGAFNPPEPPPETRWAAWAPQAPLAPGPPVATENPEVQGWMASETPILKNIEVSDIERKSTSIKGKVYGAKPTSIIAVWGETEEGVSDHENWDDFATLGQKFNEEFERLIAGLSSDTLFYLRIKAVNTEGIETWTEPLEFRTLP